MSESSASTPLRDETRPPEEPSAAALAMGRVAADNADPSLPLDAREGVATVTLTGDNAAVGALTRGELPSVIASVAFPAVASMLLMTLFATADSYWVGRQIGPAGLAAVSTSIFWVWVIISCAEMVSVGLTAVAARRHGERRPDQAARAVGDAVALSFTLGAVIAVAGHLMLTQMFGVMHTPTEVSAMGYRYLGTYLYGAPLIFGFFAIDAGFRASGDTQTPFVMLATSVVVALLLDPVLIMGLGPAPQLGIAGAATATVFTRSVVFVVGIAILTRRGMIRFGRPSARTLASIVRVGLPTALTGVLFSLVYVFLTRTTSRFGTPALAALGVGHRVEAWTYMVGVGLGAAAAAVVGQNLGAREVRRASRAGWIAAGYSTIVGGIGGALQLIFAVHFASLFTNDPAVIAESSHYLRIASLSTLLSGCEVVLEGALGGAGDTLPPMLTSTSITALRLPLAAWAAPRFGTAGIWWVIVLTAVGRSLAMMAIWRRGRWARKSV